MFIAIYRHAAAARGGFDFEPETPGDAPACWSWAADGSEIRMEPRERRLMIFEPGKRSARFAHELFFEDKRRDDLPLIDSREP